MGRDERPPRGVQPEGLHLTALLLGAPYVRHCLQTSQIWRRSVARENLTLLVGDAVGLAALARGSVAARTLLL